MCDDDDDELGVGWSPTGYTVARAEEKALCLLLTDNS